MKTTFSELQLEILRVLSDLPGGGSVHDVFDIISKHRSTTQASINSTMSAMHKDGMLSVTRDSRPKKFKPANAIKSKHNAALADVAERIFGSKAKMLLNLFLSKASPAEREDVKKVIDEMD